MSLRIPHTVIQRCKHHAHCNSGRLGGRTIMSPSELISTRCPGRLYMNRNLPERGTVSCSQVGGFPDANLITTGSELRIMSSKHVKAIHKQQQLRSQLCSCLQDANLRTWSLMTFHSCGTRSLTSRAKAASQWCGSR